MKNGSDMWAENDSTSWFYFFKRVKANMRHRKESP